VTDPIGEIDARFSRPNAEPTPWHHADDVLTEAQIYWLSTARADGRPHVTPLIAIWHEGAAYFCTGPTEQKAKNLQRNPQCVLTAGADSLNEGLDVVVEGTATAVVDDATLHQIADAYEAKYGSDWAFTVRDGGFATEHGQAVVYRIAAMTVFGFGKATSTQTRWRFTIS
jgi:PPOX class probable F420-dependent enzyme